MSILVSKRSVKLTEKEAEIFRLLRGCVATANLPVTLRVAGGWVRDKLLGLDCHDLDIAIDRMMGQTFAERLTDYLRGLGISATSCGVIQSNPDRSKHLETATLAVNGQLIDFVNLRAETYASHSRIPDSVAFGTPTEDALRRDITINAMFWNIHTEEVEDFTGHGMDDLNGGIVRTPLAPRETLLDDPLRLLRVIRFATRFQYAIVPELLDAMQDAVVHQSLRDKVSRERVGIELDKILSDRHGLQGLFLINRVGVFNLIFGGMDMVSERIDMKERTDTNECIDVVHDGIDMTHDRIDMLIEQMDPCNTRIDTLLHAFSKIVNFNSDWTREQRRLALLACGMLPAAGVEYPLRRTHFQPGATVKHDFVVHAIVRDALKLSNREMGQVGALLNHVERIERLLFDDGKRDAVKIGRLLQDIGAEWRLAFHLATVRRFWWDEQDPGVEVVVREYLGRLSDAMLYIDGIGLSDAWSLRPLLSGQEIQSLLEMRPGAGVGRALRDLLDWQYAHPTASVQEAADHLFAHHRQQLQ